MRLTVFRLMVLVLLALASSVLVGCNGGRSVKAPAVDDSPTEMRADPGYMQWLEKQSMLRASQDLGRIVSGATIPWISPSVTPRPEQLLTEAPVWFTMHPASVLTSGNTPLFTSLQHPEFWRQFQRMGFRGLIIAPVRESGGVWGYDISGTQALGADTVQYAFSKYAGGEKDFGRLLKEANAAGAIMGDVLVPAATGRGADFFLSARAKPEYQGIYCQIEIPREAWALLPDVQEQWQAVRIDDASLETLRRQGLLPQPRLRDISGLPLPQYGWAATGDVRGIDGVSRRFAYLYCGTPERPVLNWMDPSASARRILSGSIIQQIGTLGVALSGVSVAPYLGMEPVSAEASAQLAKGGDLRAFTATARSAAESIAQEIRRYGGWSYLQDALPLPMLGQFLVSGPDMALDHAGSVSAQMALLTGNATMLRETLGAMHALGIDRRRLVHVIQPEGGVDLSFMHMFGMRDDAARPFRERYRKAAEGVIAGAGGALFLRGDTLHVTPAGLVALAAGIGNMRSMNDGEKAQVRDGMLALALYQAMQPGIFMLSGRELVGTMPLPQGLVPARSEEDALLQNMMGAYDLLGTVKDSLITPLGMPRAKAAFGSLPEQALTPYSFGWSLHRALLVRDHYRVPLCRPMGLLPTTHDGSVLQLFSLPPDASGQSGLLLVATNFSREPVTEHVKKGASSVLDAQIPSATPLDLLAEEGAAPQAVSLDAKGLQLELAGWQTRVILLGGRD